MSITRLDKLLKPGASGGLGDIVRRAQDMDNLTARLRADLDPEVAAHLVAANVRGDGELVVVASTSAWAAKLRFECERLMRIAQSDDSRIRSFRVRVSSGAEQGFDRADVTDQA